MSGKFFNERMCLENRKWRKAIERKQELYIRSNDIRTEFGRDYTRILHSPAYRRLKHKTQVFFATQNDHICTRIEHVNHVASVSLTISEKLGLNSELVQAIAIGHDLGHAPFGHHGEEVLAKLAKKELKMKFWHERNGLRVVDLLNTLADPDGVQENLLLTYAVRDGIISHCGEVDQNGIKPRRKAIDLERIIKKNQYQPYTWEGCVVKVSDKIAYLGRDIEDALTLRLIPPLQTRRLIRQVREQLGISIRSLSNTAIMHSFIVNLCESSDPDRGLALTREHFELMAMIKKFNYDFIYNHPRLRYYKDYASLILTSIFSVLKECESGDKTLENVLKLQNNYPVLGQYFSEWVLKYSDVGREMSESRALRQYWPTTLSAPLRRSRNMQVYHLVEPSEDYSLACIDFIAGMTDNFAERIFREITALT